MSNLLGLAVLGVLAQRPMHRYEIATTIRAQGKADDMAVKWGSLYTVVDGLERRGLVEATGTDRSGARPERTTYRITAAGLHAMADWTRDLLASTPAAHTDFVAGLSMLGAVSPDEATTLLRDRVERIARDLGDARTALSSYAARVPRLFLVEDEYAIAVRAAEVTWLQNLVGELENGTFPGIEEWRRVQAELLPPEGSASD